MVNKILTCSGWRVAPPVFFDNFISGHWCHLSLAAGHWPEAVSSITFRFNFSESCPVPNSPHKGGSTGLFWKLPGTCGISADADGEGRWAADLAGKRPLAAAHCTHSKSAPLCAVVHRSAPLCTRTHSWACRKVAGKRRMGGLDRVDRAPSPGRGRHADAPPSRTARG